MGILGFFMTYSRGQLDMEEAMPIVSRAWPLGVMLLCFLFPSTNWFEPTFLTYPFLERAIDRFLYVTFTFVCIFTLDRLSRDKACVPMPDVLQWASLLLYLFHPVFIAILVTVGLQDAILVWLLSTALSTMFAAILVAVRRRRRH